MGVKRSGPDLPAGRDSGPGAVDADEGEVGESRAQLGFHGRGGAACAWTMLLDSKDAPPEADGRVLKAGEPLTVESRQLVGVRPARSATGGVYATASSIR